MKKFIYLLVIPLVALPFLTSCNNSVRWISKEEFKEKVNEYFPSKPFEKYVDYYFITMTYKGEPIEDESLITNIEEQDGIYTFASKSGETTTTFLRTILSPNLTDYASDMDNVTKCGITSGGNFVLRFEQRLPLPRHRVVSDVDYTYSKDLVLIHSSFTQRVGDEKFPTISYDWVYKKR